MLEYNKQVKLYNLQRLTLSSLRFMGAQLGIQ